MATTHPTRPTKAAPDSLLSYLYRPEVRQFVWQVLLLIGLIALFWMVISNTRANLAKQNIASGLGFWDRTAGFDISQSLIEYTNTSSYGRAFWVGLWNTVIVAVIGIFFATILGFVMGIARLSSNWLIARLATVYVEIVRNIPLLLQLFIWYFAVLKSLPGPRDSHNLGFGTYLNVRGLYMPSPIPEAGFGVVLTALAFGIIAAIATYMWARRRQMLTGQRFPVLWASLGLIVLLPLLAYLALGRPLSFDYPAMKGFNFDGGLVVQPEFMALLVGLVFYTGGFIAEIVRAGIAGVPKGQKEAARAIGLSSGQMLRLVVVPQAMRIIIPPLTSQFLNLTKNSSLAVAIAYPDLVSVFAGTVLNQTGQAVEVILITMAVYLTLSLLTSAFMNWFNARMKLVER
jgi:general L-amino acid transport system permease protein